MKLINKILDNKLVVFAISLVLSLLAWVYVTSGETTETIREFRNIPVQFVGEDTLESLHDLVITDVDTNSVSVEIRGPRRIVNALDASDMVAQVDVSKLSQAAYTSLNYQIVYPAGTEKKNLVITNRSQDTINFMVTMLTSRTIPVVGGFEGKVAEGFTAETPVFEPSTVTVEGPEIYLKNVHHVYVTFGKDQIVQSTYTVDTGYILADANNDPVSTTGLKITPETIRATLPIMEMKVIPLNVGILAGAGATETNTKITIEPKSITLAGDSSALAGFNQIVLDTIDLSEFASVYTATYPIQIPNGLVRINSPTEAKVTIEIIGVETREFNVTNFSWVGATDDMVVEMLSENIQVRMRGPSEVLDALDPEQIIAEIDLSDLQDTTGTYMLSVKIRVEGQPDVGAIKREDGTPYIVALRITRAEE
ncbi:MAG: hypothetical protein IK095_04130 [Oscillospiraceae bacterium]|nr:hypothetical protein [Oscillospiraceae bacterium]